eukprot:TRINITY_DN47070_c0_g1_i1.p1 TRINITY_DN47070_c0_g1~~TRINITY_DN47070_c0_g1_i1.p1  ORF type:complete len:588 (+),score=132.40 TRINITY_DN47070_c0_g1_i1:71-1834(+)
MPKRPRSGQGHDDVVPQGKSVQIDMRAEVDVVVAALRSSDPTSVELGARQLQDQLCPLGKQLLPFARTLGSELVRLLQLPAAASAGVWNAAAAVMLCGGGRALAEGVAVAVVAAGVGAAADHTMRAAEVAVTTGGLRRSPLPLTLLLCTVAHDVVDSALVSGTAPSAAVAALRLLGVAASASCGRALSPFLPHAIEVSLRASFGACGDLRDAARVTLASLRGLLHSAPPPSSIPSAEEVSDAAVVGDLPDLVAAAAAEEEAAAADAGAADDDGSTHWKSDEPADKRGPQTEGGRTGSVTWGCAYMQGKRPSMEDAHAVLTLRTSDCSRVFAAVFDGHGDEGVTARAAADRLPLAVTEQPAFASGDMPTALANAMVATDDWLRTADLNPYGNGRSVQPRYSDRCGTCVACAVVDVPAGVVCCAHLGDSRVVVYDEDFNVLWVTADHKPSNGEESTRIWASGGSVVVSAGVPRVVVPGCRQRLAISRSLGNHFMKPVVSSACEPRSVELPAKGGWVLIACDGVWDARIADEREDMVPMTAATVARMIKEELDGKADVDALCRAVRKLASSCLNSQDNVTCILAKIPPRP